MLYSCYFMGHTWKYFWVERLGIYERICSGCDKIQYSVCSSLPYPHPKYLKDWRDTDKSFAKEKGIEPIVFCEHDWTYRIIGKTNQGLIEQKTCRKCGKMMEYELGPNGWPRPSPPPPPKKG